MFRSHEVCEQYNIPVDGVYLFCKLLRDLWRPKFKCNLMELYAGVLQDAFGARNSPPQVEPCKVKKLRKISFSFSITCAGGVVLMNGSKSLVYQNDQYQIVPRSSQDCCSLLSRFALNFEAVVTTINSIPTYV